MSIDLLYIQACLFPTPRLERDLYTDSGLERDPYTFRRLLDVNVHVGDTIWLCSASGLERDLYKFMRLL